MLVISGKPKKVRLAARKAYPGGQEASSNRRPPGSTDRPVFESTVRTDISAFLGLPGATSRILWSPALRALSGSSTVFPLIYPAQPWFLQSEALPWCGVLLQVDREKSILDP